MRAFHLAVPPEFRAPVPATAAVAVAMWAWVIQEIEFAMVVLMAHRCLLRPAEAQNIPVSVVALLGREDAGQARGRLEDRRGDSSQNQAAAQPHSGPACPDRRPDPPGLPRLGDCGKGREQSFETSGMKR